MGFLSKAEVIRLPLDEGVQVLQDPSLRVPPDPLPLNNKEDLKATLEQYHKLYSSMGGIIIKISKEEIPQLNPMVSHFALVEDLATGHCLILFPESLDRDLIAHRLEKNLNTEIPLIFSAKNPAEVLEKIRQYL